MRGGKVVVAACAAAVAGVAACNSNTVTYVDVTPDATPPSDDAAPGDDTDAGIGDGSSPVDASSGVVLRTTHKCGPGAVPPDGGVCSGACPEEALEFVEPAGMAVLHADQYAIGYITSGDTVSRCFLPNCFGDPEQLYAGSSASDLTSIAVSEKGIYWVAGNTDIWRSDHLGKNAVAVAKNPSHYISLDGMAAAGGMLFWNDVIGPIFSCDAANCDATKKQLDVGSAHGLTASATRIYWSGPEDGTLHSAALDGTDPKVIAAGLDPDPVGVAVDDCHLYWYVRSAAPTILRCALTDCQNTRQVVASIGRTIVIGAIAVDDRNVYLLDRNGQKKIAVQKP